MLGDKDQTSPPSGGGFDAERLADPKGFTKRLVWAIALGPPRARPGLPRSPWTPVALRRRRRRRL